MDEWPRKLTPCNKCGQMFRPFEKHPESQCLDCRMNCSESATRKTGKEADEYMHGGIGYRLVRGFGLIGRGYDNQ